MGKNLPAMPETQDGSLGREDPLEKGMATHSGILAWRIPWTEKPGSLQSMGSQRVGHDWRNRNSTKEKRCWSVMWGWLWKLHWCWESSWGARGSLMVQRQDAGLLFYHLLWPNILTIWFIYNNAGNKWNNSMSRVYISWCRDKHDGPQQWSPPFLAPGISLGLIQPHYIYCTLYFYYYYISSTSDPQASDVRGWGPLVNKIGYIFFYKGPGGRYFRLCSQRPWTLPS